MPLSDSGAGPLLTAVPLMKTSSLMSRMLMLESIPSRVTVRFGDGVMLKLKEVVVGRR